MKITLSSAKNKVVVPEQTKEFTELEIERVVDFAKQKKVVAFIEGFGPLLLWEGADYDAAGQWTDTDVDARIKAIF